MIPHAKLWLKAGRMLLALAAIGLLGFVDYWTGRDLTMSAFYLAPICWGTWKLGREAGAVLSGAAALVWLAADMASAHAYQSQAIPDWNALMLLAFFLPVVWLLSAFRQIHRNLEITVERRTAALRFEIKERQRLENAKIHAERMAMVGTMATQVAHEVRNPLGAISLTLDLLQREFDDIERECGHPAAEARNLALEMREEVLRIDKVVTDYLAIARPRTTRRQATELTELIRRKLNFMRGTFEQAGVELAVTLDASPTVVRADPEQLWQAVLNLIRNSLEAMPSGGTLTITVGREKYFAVLSVRDTGSGMSREQQERLFIPFATTKANGTGLGLPLVQQIITEHDGRVVCTSEPGKGAVFMIFLPVLKETKPAGVAENPPAIPCNHLTHSCQ